MASDVAPWNLLQIAFIVVYPAWMSFTNMPNGMSLLAAYLFLIVLCVPPVFIQLKLGNHQQKGIVGLLSTHIPILKGIGVTLLIQLFLMCVLFAPLVTHYGMYAFIAVAKHPYVWSGCNHPWVTQSCIGGVADVQMNVKPGTPYHMSPLDENRPVPAEAQFFDKEYLQISANISDVRGFPVWKFSEQLEKVNFPVLPLALAAVWVFVFISLAFGPRVCGWILFLLGPGFLSLIFTVLGYGYSQLDSNATNTFLGNLYTMDMSQFYKLHEENTPLIKDWISGFSLVVNSVPVWTAILPTMGKMTGNGRLSRNISWMFVILVYAATCQIPQLAMAPYIGNLQQLISSYRYNIKGLDVIFTTMPSAFAQLGIPPVYALLFYLSIFLAGLMFLIVAMFTILDNLVDGLVGWSESFQERRGCINFCAAFALISVGVGTSILHTTQAGMYYIIVMDQCTMKLLFLTVAIYGLSMIIIYAKQNFGIAERIVMSMWCGVSTLITAAIFLYKFITELGDIPRYRAMEIKGLWDLVCWVLASAPFLAIPAAMIHACQQETGSCREKTKYVMCGIKQDQFDPPEEYGYRAPDPSAPPYGTNHDGHTYSYTDDEYPMEDLPYYKTNQK